MNWPNVQSRIRTAKTEDSLFYPFTSSMHGMMLYAQLAGS